MTPRIYKLTYTNKEQAVADLEAKQILTENGYGEGVQAVVEIGLIVLDVVDEQPIYADGYHYDVMSTETYDFGANLVVPKNPKHAFAGYPITEEVHEVQ
jgi:translation elongation factor P/translation initiation factor 5A